MPKRSSRRSAHVTKCDASNLDGSTPFRLLDLPAEIRAHIYSYLPSLLGFGEDQHRRVRASRDYSRRGLERSPFPIMFASRQLYHETRLIFYRHVTCCIELDGTVMPPSRNDISKKDTYRRTVFNGCVDSDTVRCVIPFLGYEQLKPAWNGYNGPKLIASLESITRVQARSVGREAKEAMRASLGRSHLRKRTLEVHLASERPFPAGICTILKGCVRTARAYASAEELQINVTHHETSGWNPHVSYLWNSVFVNDMQALDVTVTELTG